MNYYEKMLDKIRVLVDSSPEEALELLNEELNIAYIPRDVHTKLVEYRDLALSKIEKPEFTLSITDISKYLLSTPEKQLVAVEELGKLNLRDHIDICRDFLIGKGDLYAKILLIVHLIKQDIDTPLKLLKENKEYDFVPNQIVLPENTNFYRTVYKLLENHFFKKPDMLSLAKDILDKECLFYLPLNYDTKDSEVIFNKICSYIEKLFH